MSQLFKFIPVILWAFVANATGAEPNAIIPRVSVSGVVYSNVVIESTSPKTVTFSHARGMASVNRLKLTLDERVALGLIPPPPTNSISSTNGFETNQVMGVNQLRKTLDASRDIEKQLRDAGVSLKAAGAGAVVLYLFFCFCLLMICSKANHPSPLLVFIPILQILPAYRAAKMSPFWFRLLMADVVFRVIVGVLTYTGHIGRLPQTVALVLLALMVVLTLIHLIGWIIWCFKICIAREKSPLV
ncbi:MAG TPA: hypothetical protein VGF13_10185, partial [Verrucomicrobiae bacterium]